MFWKIFSKVTLQKHAHVINYNCVTVLLFILHSQTQLCTITNYETIIIGSMYVIYQSIIYQIIFVTQGNNLYHGKPLLGGRCSAFATDNGRVFTYQDGFWVWTLSTKNKSLDETIQQTLQLAGVMRSIDNVAIILQVKLCLSTQFTPKVLCRIYNSGCKNGHIHLFLQVFHHNFVKKFA